MHQLAEKLNQTLGPVADMLSPAGRRLYFPYGGILGQGAEARACDVNATIGMAFEEDGSPLVMKCFADLVNLDRKAFLYAGSFGLLKLRETWKAMQVKKRLTDELNREPTVGEIAKALGLTEAAVRNAAELLKAQA